MRRHSVVKRSQPVCSCWCCSFISLFENCVKTVIQWLTKALSANFCTIVVWKWHLSIAFQTAVRFVTISRSKRNSRNLITHISLLIIPQWDTVTYYYSTYLLGGAKAKIIRLKATKSLNTPILIEMVVLTYYLLGFSQNCEPLKPSTFMMETEKL